MRVFSLLIILSVVISQTFLAQNSKFISFELLYLKNNTELTPTQQRKLNAHITHAQTCNIQGVFIDNSRSISDDVTNLNRANFIKSYLELRGIEGSYIEIIQTSEQPADIIHNLSDGIDALTISISYTSDDPIRKFSDTAFSPNYERSLFIESGLESTSTKEQINCGFLQTIDLPNGFEILMNNCDYSKQKEALVFTSFSGSELELFKKVPELSDDATILGAYHFKTRKSQPLRFPASLRVPIEKCMNKFELSLYYCNDTACTLIPVENIYNPGDEFVLFKIAKAGEYYLIHEHIKKKYEINIIAPKSYDFSLVDLNSGCHGLFNRAALKKNKAKVSISDNFYEPTVTAYAYDKRGVFLNANNIPLSQLKGEGEIKKLKVKSAVNGMEIELILYEKYYLKENQFRTVVTSIYR